MEGTVKNSVRANVSEGKKKSMTDSTLLVVTLNLFWFVWGLTGVQRICG